MVDRYLNGTATEDECQLLKHYFDNFQQSEPWNEAELGNKNETEARILKRLSAAIRQKPQALAVPFYRQRWLQWVAAVIVLFLSVALWKSQQQEKKEGMVATQSPQMQSRIHKGTTLTLPDGKVMVLDKATDGVLVKGESAIIRKEGTNILVNIAAPVKASRESNAGMHLLKTPNGQQYKAVLADGSQVWLNAASSLRFPAVFAKHERRVEVSGEAYFEVTKDKARPFRVMAVAQNTGYEKATLVEVLGTQFNVTAYADEGLMKTTLVEGSLKVAVAKGGSPAPANGTLLLPGEQAEVSSLDSAGDTLAVKKANVEEAMAWKSNVFHFSNTGLQSIMRQLARWYDVEVVYATKIPVRHFSGKISRSATLATVLEILEQSNIHFTVRGKQIIVKS